MTDSISRERLGQAIVTLLAEGVVGTEEGPVWFTDARAGLLQVLRGLSHAAASTPPGPGRNTVVAHVEHLRYSLNLANRALRGENAYATANWEESWALQSVDEAGWKRLLDELEREYRALVDVVASTDAWVQGENEFTGTLANLVHVGYHLGAIRQIVRSLEGATAS